VNVLLLETNQTHYVLYLATSNNSMAEVTLIPLNSDSRIGLGQMRKFC
jgi:hypothetical protein